MSILNVNQIQPVGSGQTVTISAANITASSSTISASSFVGPLTGNATGLTGTPNLNVGIVTATSFSGSGSGLTGVGKILQVVYGNYSTGVPTTSTSYVDTGLSVSITPSSTSSKILVLVSQTLSPTTSGSSGYGRYQLLRGASVIYEDARIDMYSQYSHNTYTISILDSPSSTSSVTYKTQMSTSNSSYTLEAQHANIRPSTMTLMEVAA